MRRIAMRPSFKVGGGLLGRLDTKRLAPLTSKLWPYRVLIRVLWIQIWTRSRLKWNAWRTRLSSQRVADLLNLVCVTSRDQIRVLQPINYKGFSVENAEIIEIVAQVIPDLEPDGFRRSLESWNSVTHRRVPSCCLRATATVTCCCC